MQITSSAPVRFDEIRKLGFLIVPLAIVIGVGVAVAPIFVLAAVGAVILVGVLANGPLTRTAVVLVSSLTILQVSAAAASGEKLGYLVILSVAAVFAVGNLVSRWSRLRAVGGIAMLPPIIAVVCVVTASSVIALTSGVPLTSWLNDVPAYGMLPVAIILGLDLAVSDHQPHGVALILFAAGLATALAFAVQWTVRHGVTSLDFGRFLFSSMFLAGAALCLALAYAFDGRRPYRMAFLATTLLFAMFVTATRGAFVFLLPVGVTLVFAGVKRRWRIATLIVGAALTALTLVVVLSVAGDQYFNWSLIQLRLGGIWTLLFSGNALSDPSLYARYLQTQALFAAWLSEPWFGVGPGVSYSYGGLVDSHPVDSPMAIFARFGVVGAFVFLGLFIAILAGKLRRQAHWVPATALLSFVGLILVWSLGSSPLDDKGVALGLIPLTGLCGIWRKGTPSRVPIESESTRNERRGD